KCLAKLRTGIPPAKVERTTITGTISGILVNLFRMTCTPRVRKVSGKAAYRDSSGEGRTHDNYRYDIRHPG
ncbi:hypothetical protein VS883_28500, partial [Escherichia coli]